MTFDHIVTTVTFDNTAAFDTIVAFGIPLVAMLMSSPVMWHKETFGILVCSKEYTPSCSYLRSLLQTLLPDKYENYL
jgi:hypothetical protein